MKDGVDEKADAGDHGDKGDFFMNCRILKAFGIAKVKRCQHQGEYGFSHHHRNEANDADGSDDRRMMEFQRQGSSAGKKGDGQGGNKAGCSEEADPIHPVAPNPTNDGPHGRDCCGNSQGSGFIHQISA